MTNALPIPWEDLIAVGIRTTADGPFDEDVFWQFSLRDGTFEIPGARVEGPALDELCSLPGIDLAKVAAAMGSTRERIFRVWHEDESRFRPSAEELASRFRALVGRLGGDEHAAKPVFERLFSAWSAESRRYHGVEHLVDCLRELDGAGADRATADRAELALVYHDYVYAPGDATCEERSARALVTDAAALAIPRELASDAADLVRATAHGSVGAPRSAAANLVVDVDLSILGRDVLRFMDFEYAVEEEYAPVPTTAFRVGRGRFLAALLARPHVFRTEHFRRRYEARARAQIGALLASPRYRVYRWLRWFPRLP